MEHRDILPAGTVLDGKYRIDRLIGAGGFGMTYEALDLGLNMRVAVKEYYPAHFGMREGTLTVRPRTTNDADLFNRLKESFLREARTLAQLRHPCIVRVLSVFEGHGTAYMIMEYESGKSLKGWLDGLGRLPTQHELDRIVMPLLEALEVLHDASFLHRDIAPDNIIVRSDGSPVLLDFGAARRVMAELSGALTGIVKSGYSPQEQYANDPRAQGPWSDIYALGATLYRCVTGQTPSEATLRMLDDPLAPASELAAGKFRPEFLAAIDRAMSLRPKERPQSVSEMRALMRERDTTIVVDPVREPIEESGGGKGWSSIEARPVEGSNGRWRRVAAAIAGAVILGGGVWLALPRSDPSPVVSSTVVNAPPPIPKEEEARIEAERQRKADEERRGREALAEIQRQAEALERRQREEAERSRLAEQQRIEQEAARRRAEEELRRAIEERNAQLHRDVLKQGHVQQSGASGSLAARLEEALGQCPFCDDVKKLISTEEYSELMGMAALIERTYNEVRERRGPREDAAARKVLEQLASAELDADPYATIKAGAARCTIYAFGFLDNAAERVGQHQCMVRMVLIGGELTSLTVEKTSGDSFHANVKKFRVNAAAFLGRTSLKGHALTSYNRAQPRNRENPNFGNKVGLLVSLGGRPALISANQNGFTEPDSTYFEVMVLGQ